MAYGEILSAVLDTELVDATGAWTGFTVTVADGIVAIFWSDGGNDGWCRTYPIAADGTVGVMIEELEFDTVFFFGRVRNVVEVAERIWLVAYRGPGNVLKVKTISIAADGTGITAINTLATALPTAVGVECVAKKGTTNTCYVAVWSDAAQDGHMATLTCDADGDNIVLADNWEFAPVRGQLPQVEYISGDIFAISYDDTLNVGQISTVAVADDGTITELLIDTQEVDAVNNATNINIAKVANGDLVVIAYVTVPGNDGVLATLTIDNAGAISAPISTRVFDAADAGWPRVIKLGTVSGISYVMVFYDNSDDDNVIIRTHSVAADGTVSVEINALAIRAAIGGGAFWAVQVRTNLWVFVYSTTPGQDTYFGTAQVDTVPAFLATFPSDPMTRITNLIHRYNRAEGLYMLEANLGEVTSDFGLPEWLTEPIPVTQEEKVTPTVGPPLVGYSPEPFPDVQVPRTREPEHGPILESIRKAEEHFPDKSEARRDTNWWQAVTPWKEEKGETVISALLDVGRTLRERFFGK